MVLSSGCWRTSAGVSSIVPHYLFPLSSSSGCPMFSTHSSICFQRQAKFPDWLREFVVLCLCPCVLWYVCWGAQLCPAWGSPQLFLTEVTPTTLLLPNPCQTQPIQWFICGFAFSVLFFSQETVGTLQWRLAVLVMPPATYRGRRGNERGILCLCLRLKSSPYLGKL